MENATLTISIVGGTLWGNRGAEAMLVTTIGQLRRRLPHARFNVFSYYPNKDRELCGDKQIQFHDCRPLTLALKVFPLALVCWMLRIVAIRPPNWMLGREVCALRDSDALLDMGGITFCDGREVFLLYNVLSLLPAMLLGVPVTKLSQAMGPFHNPINRLAASIILRRCQRVFARGDATARHLADLRLPPKKWSRACDIAFAYEPSFSLTKENDDKIDQIVHDMQRRRARCSHTVTLIASSLLLKKSDDYIDTLVGVIHELLQRRIHVSLLPNATRAGYPKARNNDLVAIDRLSRLLHMVCANEELERLSAVTFDVNTASIRRLLADADVVVTSRFHGMVAALSMSIPTIVIGWSHKYGEVLSQFDFNEFGFDHRDAGRDISQAVFKMLEDNAAHRTALRERLRAVQQSAVDQFEYVATILTDQSPCSSLEAPRTDRSLLPLLAREYNVEDNRR